MVKRIVLVLLCLGPVSVAQTLQEFRGVKLTNVDSQVLFTDDNIAEAMDYLAGIGINVVLPVVLNRSHTLYPSAVMDRLFGAPILPDFAGRDPLARVIIEAHRNGMEVLPWFEYGFAASYSANGGHILARFPHWGLHDNTGKLLVKNGFDWMSGVNPEVQQFMIALVTEILDHYDVDGMEFSDRIPAMPVEGGYDSVTVAVYRAEHGGAPPPGQPRTAAWMRWRADKLNQFYRAVRDTVKQRSPHLLVSSSPSVYPWSYEEYLQDGKTWVEEGIVDNFIPQLYRYSLNDYIFELNKSLSYVPLSRRGTFYAGILAKVGSYVITPQFLLASVQANRDRNVQGEAFFFYEALRAGNDLLGDTLKATFYAEPALLPERAGQVWRPPATIVNENDPGVMQIGNWIPVNAAGFEPQALRTEAGDYAAVIYSFSVPFSAWFSLYAYVIPLPTLTAQARYVAYSQGDSSLHYLSQRDYHRAGWQKITEVYLPAGRQTVLKLDNTAMNAGESLFADAAMIMINRKLSPEVVVTSVAAPRAAAPVPQLFTLEQGYPNPFRTATRIRFSLDRAAPVKMQIYDALGRWVTTLVQTEVAAGTHEVPFSGARLAGGLYFCRLEVGHVVQIRKLVLLQ